MKRTRYQYHYAVRRCKSNKLNIQKQRLVENIHNCINFRRDIKKINLANKLSTTIMDNANGDKLLEDLLQRTNRRYYIGSKRHSLQAGELSQRTQAAVQIVSNLPAPSNGGTIYRFFGHAGHADPLDGWRYCSQKRVMSRPIQVRQL